MLIIPAVDIQDGCVVRFVQGRLNKKVYSKDPVKTAKHWARQGAQLIHIVDLDGANTGEAKNISIAKEIARSVEIPVQFGGGVRTREAIRTLLDAGISRVILGTKAVQDKSFLQKAFKEFKDKIIVSIDARDGQVFIRGWQEEAGSKVDALEFARALKGTGFTQAIYTDISKDGTLKGPNIIDTKRLLKTGLSIIVSGGISSLEDIRKLKVLENDGCAGIIVGKALYEGKFTLAQALKLT
jgi:phosphoribosylformimino-5-aminoimidazole carboxamide ribotide isomerase